MSVNPVERFVESLPVSLRDRWFLKVFGWAKVPMIAWVGARIVALEDRRCVIAIPLKRRTKNHLNSLYIGVLCVGADVAGGLMAVRRMRASGRPVSFVFKDLAADFHRRAEGTTYFTCEDGEILDAMVEETLRTGERVHRTVTVVATVPSESDEPVATFRLTMSVKARSVAGA